MSTSGYAVSAKVPRIRANRNRITPVTSYKENKMKLTFKQKIRNWLMNDDDDSMYAQDIAVSESPSIDSDGFRLQVYKASGGIIVETRKYDRKHDENRNSLYVVTEDKDLGEEIGKIITMEQLR